MKVIADALIKLPFELDYCAKGPNVDPLSFEHDGWSALLYFPPSMSDGTDGKGIFHEWAWWTGTTLRLVLEQTVETALDPEPLRQSAAQAISGLVRSFLNTYRIMFTRPDVCPIRIEASNVRLLLESEDGTCEELPEASDGYFFNKMPAEPPLTLSLNETNIAKLHEIMLRGETGSPLDHLRLDIQRLRSQGELERASQLETLEQSL